MILDNIFRYIRWRKPIKIIRKFSYRPVVCDVGCGTNGKFLNKISRFIDKGFGFDKNIISYKSQKIVLKKIDLEKEKIPLEGKKIDIVNMVAVLEHLNYPDNILKEINRILKINGFLILTTPDPKAEYILNSLAFLGLINKKHIAEHKKYYSKTELKNLLIKIGFPLEKIKIKAFEFGLNILVIAQK